MNFLEIVKAMKEGKEVRRKCWNKGMVYLMVDDYMKVKFCDGSIDGPDNHYESYEATDWEIVEEPKPFVLADKSLKSETYVNTNGNLYHIKDIKTFIRLVKENPDKINELTGDL